MVSSVTLPPRPISIKPARLSCSRAAAVLRGGCLPIFSYSPSRLSLRFLPRLSSPRSQSAVPAIPRHFSSSRRTKTLALLDPHPAALSLLFTVPGVHPPQDPLSFAFSWLPLLVGRLATHSIAQATSGSTPVDVCNPRPSRCAFVILFLVSSLSPPLSSTRPTITPLPDHHARPLVS
ncbi:hypothetical protein VTO73DRAFT_13392 [Trametes versicolor]